MLLIKDYDVNQSYRTLKHGADVFHKALENVLKGEKRFHVEGADGLRYDLEYKENQSLAEASALYPDSPLFRDTVMYPPYFQYDENSDRLCMDVLKGIDEIWVEEANEYTVVLTGILLRKTSCRIFTRDERILWFYPVSDRLSVTDMMRPKNEGKRIHVVQEYYPSGFLADFGTQDAVTFFHHIFIFQWLTDLPFEQAKYVELLVKKSEGIGSILTTYSRAKQFFEDYGLKTVIRPGSSRYTDELLSGYFELELTPEDSDESNTVYLTNYYGVLFTKMLREGAFDFGMHSLKPSFVAEMKEYGDAVMGDKKMLGILLRGSDYITTGMSGVSRPVTVETAIPKIREWMEADGFDGIFLATEDQDILDQMREAFPGKIKVVAQERYRVLDFGDAVTISEVDRKRHPGEDYDRFITDATVNYFYALYLLSRCDSFMYSGQCGGIVLAKGLAEKDFRRMYCFAEDKEWQDGTEVS